MMYLWLPGDIEDKVPAYGTHHLGVAGEFFVLTVFFFFQFNVGQHFFCFRGHMGVRV